jgi:hypothetical protein
MNCLIQSYGYKLTRASVSLSPPKQGEGWGEGLLPDTNGILNYEL